MTGSDNPYALAQAGIAQIKTAIYVLLRSAKDNGLSNADIGRSLGIYGGHIGHAGHISRSLLAVMEAEGVVEQDQSNKLWQLRAISTGSDVD